MRPAPRPASPRLPSSSKRIELRDGGWAQAPSFNTHAVGATLEVARTWAPRASDRTGNRPYVSRQQGDRRPYTSLRTARSSGRHDRPGRRPLLRENRDETATWREPRRTLLPSISQGRIKLNPNVIDA